MATWTTTILNSNEQSIIKMEKIYIEQGIKAAKEVKSNQVIENAKEIYNSINDYILDGMPCDRVNEIIISEDDCVEYRRRICVHKDIWNKENGDVNIFYKLRCLWIKAFVNELNSDFEYTENSDGISIIKRK